MTRAIASSPPTVLVLEPKLSKAPGYHESPKDLGLFNTPPAMTESLGYLGIN